MNTFFQRPDRVNHPLDVIVTCFNSARYRTRWKHYEDFISMAERADDAVRLWTVEVAFGQREFSITESTQRNHLQLRTSAELWHKERSQNLLLQYVLGQNTQVEYVAFVDADITFVRHDWADETLHALQHYDVVQMWQEAHDLDQQGHIMQKHQSFASCYLAGARLDESVPIFDGGYYHHRQHDRHHTIYWHPGYAWAWRRRALDKVGGLIDWAILGSADFHMAHALIGEVERTVNPRLHPNYCEAMRMWQERAEREIKRNVGCVPGSILHHYHGPKVNRRYKSRWKILEETQFDQSRDLKTDTQGLFNLQHHGDLRSNKLRDLTRHYFHQRNEDA